MSFGPISVLYTYKFSHLSLVKMANAGMVSPTNFGNGEVILDFAMVEFTCVLWRIAGNRVGSILSIKCVSNSISQTEIYTFL